MILVHDFMNFSALKITLKIHKNIIKKDPGLILTQGNLLVNNVPTKYQLLTPCGFHDIARTRCYKSRSLQQGQIKVTP